MMKSVDLLEAMVCTRTGLYREANLFTILSINKGSSDMFDEVFSRPEKVVFHEDLIPPEILFGMGLNPWLVELLGIIGPLMERTFAEPYIDVAENEGIPPDVCSLPKSTMGLVLEGQMPEPIAMVASNMPCDGGMSSYTVIEREIKVPTFRLDIPHNFNNERAIEYFVGELKRLITWLEEHTSGRMDWDRMREVCEERNRATEYELELWDMIRAKPAPMAAEPIYISHLMYMIARPGQEIGTRHFQRLVEFAKKIYENGHGAIPHECYRTVVWNPPTLCFPELLIWAEQAYGVALIMDMLTYNRHPFIDTSTPETMLRGLARIIMEGPMARHTRGPAENFFSDLFHLYEHFSLDMIWMAGHIGCKNTQALMGMFREKCRERDIPLLVIDYDLSDTRIVSPDGIRKQVEQFMETVMKAERMH